MTRVFDEDGSAIPVTVVEAGPSKITALRNSDRDGYDAVQLAGDPDRGAQALQGRAGPPEEGRRRPVRTVVEFRDAELPGRQRGTPRAARERRRSIRWGLRAQGRRRRHGRRLRARRQVKVSAVSIGKGFQGTIKRHNFSRGPVTHGSHNVRAPGSIGASADPARVFKGMGMPGRMGGRRVTQRGATVVEVDAERNLLLIRGSVPGGAQRDRRGAQRWLRQPRRSAAKPRPPSAKAPVLGKQAKADLPKALFSEPFHESLVHEAARADLNARRRGTHSTLTRGEVAMTTAKAWRQKGTGRARVGALSVPHRYGGGAAFGPKPRHYTFKVNRKARRQALRAALTVHAERGTVAVLDGSGFEEPATKQAAGAGEVGRRRAGAGRARRRGGRRRQELPQHPRRQVALATAAGVADVIGAASLVVSEAALEGARREGRADGRAPGDHPAGRLREELRADGRRQVHLPGPRPGPQDSRSRRRSRRSSAST